MKRLAALALLLFALAGLKAAVLHEDDFEGLGELRFHATLNPGWVGSRKAAEEQGLLQVHRLALSTQGEKSHSGVMSYVIDVTVDKSDSKWGGACLFRGPDLRIPLDRPVYLSGFIYPDLLPPDVQLALAVLFTYPHPETGKPVAGNVRLPAKGVDPEGWLVFEEDITELTKKRFPGAVMTGYLVEIRSGRAFHGQRIRLYLDDVAVKDAPSDLKLAADGTIRGHDILAGGPYEVNYLSYYREVPPEAKNRVFNSSFELGLKDWFPMVQRLRADDPEIPDPAAVFAAAEVTGAPHGGRVLQVRRNGKGSRMLLQSLPLKIRDGKDYTLSFYARASRDTELSVNSRKVKLTTAWQRHTVALPQIKCYETWNHKKFPNRFRLMLDQRGDEDLELDAFQLEEGPLTSYRGFGAVEAAARPLALYGLFGPEEKPRFEVTVFNDAAEKREAAVKWQLKDYRRASVAEGETKLTLEPGTGQRFTVEAPAGRRHYTLYLRLTAPGQPEQTAAVSASAVKNLAGLPGNHFFGACPIEGDNPPNLHDILELNRRLGFSFQVNYHTAYQSRAPKEWRENNPQWRMIENVADFSRRSGLEVLLTNYDPFPAGTRRGPDGGEHVTPENLRDVEEYHRELAARFKGKVACFETFAEYLKTPLETRAAAADLMIRAAYRGIKAGNPEAVFCAVGENKMDEGMLLAKLEALFKHGTLAYMDYLSLHPYDSHTAAFPETLVKLRALIHRYNGGQDKFILGTEGGIPGTDTLYYDDINPESLFYEKFLSELDQAEALIRSNLVLFGGGLFRRNALFYPWNGKNSTRNSMYHFVTGDNGLHPKVIYPAAATLVEQLSGAEPAGEFEARKSSGLQGYLFRKNGRLFAALYLYTPDHREKQAVLALPPGKLRAFNLVGEPIALPPGPDTRLTLSGGALYLHPGEGVSDAEFAAALRKLRVENPTVGVVLGSDGKPAAEIFNDSPTELSGKLFAEPGGEIAAFRIPAGEKRLYPLPFAPASGVLANWSLRLDTDRGVYHSGDFRLLFCRKLAKPPALDGTFTGWEGIPSFRLGAEHQVSLYQARLRGPEDLAAEIRTGWDEQCFYLAARVTDDRHETPHSSPELLWANDALQLLFVMSGDLANASSGNLLELAVSDTKRGPRFSVTNTERSDRPDLAKLRAAVRREGGDTCYELAIPWEFLKPGFKPDNALLPGFNLAVSDNDGGWAPAPAKLGGYEKSLQLAKGLVDSKNPAFAPRLYFLK